MEEITIYSTDYCPYCVRAKALLDSKNIVYTEIDVTHDTVKRREMEAKANRKTVPQIFIGEKHIGGCDDLHALEESGELDKLLNMR